MLVKHFNHSKAILAIPQLAQVLVMITMVVPKELQMVAIPKVALEL